MTLRAYEPQDRRACLAIFDSNGDRFFSAGDRTELEQFLEAPPGSFAVLCDEAGRTLGCGGLAPARDDGHAAVLTWGMVHAAHHGQGLGRLLIEARLRWIVELPGVECVRLHTSQLTAGFFRKFGFVDKCVLVDGYRPGLHRHDMELRVGQALRQHLQRCLSLIRK